MVTEGRGHDVPPLPSAWRADKILGGNVVRDANGQALAYIYSRDDADAGNYWDLGEPGTGGGRVV